MRKDGSIGIRVKKCQIRKFGACKRVIAADVMWRIERKLRHVVRMVWFAAQGVKTQCGTLNVNPNRCLSKLPVVV